MIFSQTKYKAWYVIPVRSTGLNSEKPFKTKEEAISYASKQAARHTDNEYLILQVRGRVRAQVDAPKYFEVSEE